MEPRTATATTCYNAYQHPQAHANTSSAYNTHPPSHVAYYPVHSEEPAETARRSKSTVANPTSTRINYNNGELVSQHPGIEPTSTSGSEDGGSPNKSSSIQSAHGSYSLRRFNSLLRKVSTVGGSMAAGLMGFNNPLLSFTPYTPPPILSPMRKGTGLFCHVAPPVTPLDGPPSKGNAGSNSIFNSFKYGR